MADAPISTGNARTAKLWLAQLFIDTPKSSFFGKSFWSTKQDNLIYVDEQLMNKAGDEVTVGVRQRMDTGYLPSGTKVDGNEGRITTFTDSFLVDNKNFGIVSDDPLSEQRAFYNMLEEDRKALIEQAAENMDQEFFNALDSTNTTSVYLEGDVVKATSTLATATEAVTAADKLSPELLTILRAQAMTGFNRRQTPLMPIRVDGENFFILLTHNDALADLENDSTYLAGQREAMERGKTNPLFRGAKSVWRGIIIFAHENISIGTNTSSVSYVQSHLLGQNALSIVFAKKPTIEKKKPAYDNEEHGWGHFSIFGVSKLQFNSKDYGAITVVTSRSKLSDIAIS